MLKRIGWLRRLYEWTRGWARRPAASWVLFGIAAADSLFFPVPSEALLFPLYAARPRRSLWFATVQLGGTAVGAAAGYLIGRGLHGPTYAFLDSLAPGRLAWIHDFLERNAFWAIFVGSFTPFSDKATVFASGYFEAPFATYMTAYLLGRAVRNYPLAVAFKRAGPRAQAWLDRYLEPATIVVTALFLAGAAALILWR